MKNKLINLIVASAFSMMPALVDAQTTAFISCPTTATQNSNIQCKISVNTDANVNGISANFALNGLSYTSLEAQNGFTVYNSSSNGFALGNTAGKTGTFVVALVNLKVENSGSITINNIDISDTSFNSYDVASQSANIKLKSTNNNLENLEISDGTLSPAFNPNTTSYTATVDADNITISAAKGDDQQTVSGIGKHTLKYGENKFDIAVKSESGAVKTYTIVITRPDNRSSNNYLKSLTVSEGKISFNKKTTSYSIDVDGDVSSITIDAELEDSNASFVSGYGARKVNLKLGKNTIQVKVKAENESVKTYTITVNRKDDRSTNNNLKSITLGDEVLNITKDKTEYTMSVDYDIKKLKVTAKPEDETAKVSIDNTDLKVGDNEIKITVTAENESIKTYIINVKRLSKDETMSDNNNVTSVNISGHEFNFNKNTYEYSITLSEDETKLNFDITLEDAKATYEIVGNENLEDGSTIVLTSKSESGIEKEYKFTILKEKASDTNYTVINALVALILLIVGFISGIFFTVIKKKNSRKPKIDDLEIKTNRV